MAGKIKCTINGKILSVDKGATIIEAFRQHEQDIAHYCWHPGLSVAGACRLCMVEIKGQNKLQIACNTLVEEGMVITNQSEKVKETVRWGLEFHLINHPLDCPICDQAGECVLQDQYMKFGQYSPLMAQNKVKKRKAVDLGSKIVLDTERCILCTRCTRFTDEVSKTKELGIFNRGDKSEIGIFKDKPLENNYALNTVDICPVGALTSKKFRFQQRVWYLKTADSVCTGCSTGCNTSISYNEEGVWRILPRYNKDINKHWMCDKGREFQYLNKKNRAKKYRLIQNKEKKTFSRNKALEALRKELILDNKNLAQTGIVLTGQYTSEEYSAFLSFFEKTFSSPHIYHWKNQPETFDDFDGLLIRGDKNPNTYGLNEVMKAHNLKFKAFSDLEENLKNKTLTALIVCGPENPDLFPELKKHIELFLKAPLLVWMSAHEPASLSEALNTVWTAPLKSHFEKTGSFMNFKGQKQEIKKIGNLVEGALDLREAAHFLEGQALAPEAPLKSLPPMKDLKENHFLKIKGQL